MPRANTDSSDNEPPVSVASGPVKSSVLPSAAWFTPGTGSARPNRNSTTIVAVNSSFFRSSGFRKWLNSSMHPSYERLASINTERIRVLRNRHRERETNRVALVPQQPPVTLDQRPRSPPVPPATTRRGVGKKAAETVDDQLVLEDPEPVHLTRHAAAQLETTIRPFLRWKQGEPPGRRPPLATAATLPGIRRPAAAQPPPFPGPLLPPTITGDGFVFNAPRIVLETAAKQGDNPLSPGSVGARRYHPRHGR